MPSKELYEQSASDGSGQIGASQLANIIGTSKFSLAGASTFMIKTTVVTGSASVVFGLTSSMLLSTCGLGFTFPFLLGSGFGFVGGLVHRWNTDVREAIEVAEEFPDLLAYHVKQYDSRMLKNVSFEEWREDLPRNIVKQSVAVAALYSAADALRTIRKQQEDNIVEKYSASSST